MSKQANDVADGIMAYLTKNGLVDLAPEIIRALRERMQLSNETVKVETAIALTADEQTEIEGMLKDNFGITSLPEFEINPTLLAGMKVSIGDKVLDMSVKAKLQRIYDSV